MKKIFTSIIVITLTGYLGIAQITIDSDDISAIFQVGQEVTEHVDIGLFNVDIGAPGGGNAWDFSNLKSSTQISQESVDVGSSPYTGDFSGADFCIKKNFTKDIIFEVDFEEHEYFKLGDNFEDMGNGEINSVDSDPEYTVYDPYAPAYKLPMTMDTEWSGTYV